MQPEVKSHPEADRIAAEVAARYGVAVRPGAVAQVPRGASGRPLPVWDGHRLIYPEWDRKKVERAAKVEAARKSRLARLDPDVLARRERVAALHAEGATVAQMAETLSVKEAVIRYDLGHLGLTPNRAKPRDPAEELRSLIARGFTRREDLAAELGWTVNWLSRVAAGAKIALPGAERQSKPRRVERQVEAMKLARQGKAAARREVIARLYGEGADLQAVMAATGAAKSTVQRDLKILGLGKRRVRAAKVAPVVRLSVVATEERRAAVSRLVAEGLNQKQIRARLGMAVDTLQRDLKALKLRCVAPAGKGFKAALLSALQVPGRSRDDLCAVLGWSRSELSRRATKARIKLPPARPEGYVVPAVAVRIATKAERMERARVLHAQGAIYAEIAAALEISEGCVHGYLNELGLTRSRHGVADRRALVAALRREGMTATGICAETGFGMAVVCADLRVLGMGRGWQP